MFVGSVPSYCCTYSWIFLKLSVLLYTVFVFQFDVADKLLLGFTYNWSVHYLHVVVGLLFRNLVARNTHSYYVVELDGCVQVLGSVQTVVDHCGPSYCELLSVVVHGMIISYGMPVDKVMTLMSGNIHNYGRLSIITWDFVILYGNLTYVCVTRCITVCVHATGDQLTAFSYCFAYVFRVRDLPVSPWIAVP